MFDLSLTATILLGAVVGIPLVGLLVFMAGALCNVEKLSFLRSLAVGAASSALMAPVTLVTLNSLGMSDWDSVSRDVPTWLRFAAIFLPIDLVVLVGLLRTPVADVSVPRGVLVWIVQLPLYLLFAALTAGGWLVWRGAEQLTREEWSKDQLIQGSKIFGGVIAAILVLVFGISMLRRFGRAR